MKQDKYLKRAFSHFGYKSNTILTESDLKFSISESKKVIEYCDNEMTKLEEIKKDTLERLDILKSVLIQIEVERYKEMNPKSQVFAVS